MSVEETVQKKGIVMQKERKQRLFVGIISNLLLVAVVAIVFYFSFSNSLITVIQGDIQKPIYRGNAENKEVSLMVNVYWGTEFLDSMLNTLKTYNAKCTFFFGGMWVIDNRELLERIKNDGHEIANHGYFHKDHKQLSFENNKLEILRTEKLIMDFVDVKTNLFAPPSGSFSTKTLEVCEELGYKVIMWSKDTIDWRDKDKYIVYKRATKDIQNGDLVLMHPTKHTAQALPDILEYYKSVGFKAVTVSDNID